ncbi:Zinc knuckle [Phytophthora infestans]|uniref:Zinc knuckle n=1 Tax=Phytophthora infestans TaxID=4787 RepID=A0A8S9UJX1_PHYIN|nr:Zinc knuckle [Phytophthora infestans]
MVVAFQKRLLEQLMDQETGTDMWAELCKIYEGKNNDATKAQKVYRLQGELHRTHLRANGDVRGHLYAMFRIRNELAELGSPLSDLQMVDMLLRSLPAQVCYNELRRKVLFSSKMSKYTPDLVRELILTAETRSKDWEKSAFGNNQGKKKQGNASSGQKSSQNKTTGDANKKRTAKADVECFNCGGKGHYKHQCPGLEDKPREKKSAKAKMARSDVKPAAQVTADATVEDTRMHKRDVVLEK